MELWSLKDHRVLIVDDCVDIRSMVRDMLYTLGATEITTARNGDEALEHISKLDFDIILCDYNLGESKDGQQILEEIRFRNLIKSTCLFVMITAENQSHMVMGAMEYFPDCYLSKPFTKPTLQSRLRKLMAEKDVTSEILEALDRESYPVALMLCDDAIKEHPRHRMLLLRLKADILFKLESYAEAKELFQNIIDERPLAWALLGLGKLHFLTNDLKQARLEFEAIIELNPNYMEAYDWLAKCMEKLDETTKAQEILKIATTKSPKALLRQRRLGEICTDLKDYAGSKMAYKQAIENGRHSCFKEVEDYNGLMQSIAEEGDKRDALRVVDKLRKDFLGDNKAGFYANVVESKLHYSFGDDAQGDQLITQAITQFDDKPETISNASLMLMAQVCLSQGNTDKGQDLIKHIVRNNHDNSKLLDQANKAFKEAGMEETGKDLIDDTCNEIYQLNNAGIKLAQEGKLQDSIALFSKAVNAMPENMAILLNASQCILLYLEKNPKEINLKKTVRSYLNRAFSIDPENVKYKALMASYNKIERSASSAS